MPFSLSNALTSIQGYTNKILAKNLYVFLIMYLNNILIYTNEADYIDSVW